jgi:hypothetical protein
MTAVVSYTKETTATTGTAAYSLAGAAAGHRGFVAAVGNGAQCFYSVTDGINFETGIGTVTAGSPDSLSRDVVLSSSNGGALVNWTSGSKDIFVVIPPERTVYADPSNSTLVNVPAGGITDEMLAKDFSGPVVVATGFTYAIANKKTLFKPAGTLASGTVTLPAPTGNGQEVVIGSTQQITALTVNPHSTEKVVNAPAFLPAGQSFRMTYSLSDTSWYAGN